MLSVLADRTFRHLFLAQVLALLGTGLASVALALLAYDIGGDRAAVVLGTMFAIKMGAYVVIAPIAGAVAARVPRRAMLVLLDLVRASVALCLPFVSEVWQIYVLIFLLQSASAAFTPTFQATVPDVLPEEGRYTRALSLSRLAYDLENLMSPALAALLLVIVTYPALFVGTGIGFLASALLVVSVILPSPRDQTRRGFYDRTTRGIRIYLATPRLQGLLALTLGAAAASAMVLVNTVVLVQGPLGLGPSQVALTLGSFGAGSMLVALMLPKWLDTRPDRPVMFAGAVLTPAAMVALSGLVWVSGPVWSEVLAAWFLMGAGFSAVTTPAGRLLRRSAIGDDRPAVFAAHFALSHACWLVCYPAAGWLMSAFGFAAALIALSVPAIAGIGLAMRLWPVDDAEAVQHSHDDLPPDHPHLHGSGPHSHEIFIDDLHPTWPKEAHKRS